MGMQAAGYDQSSLRLQPEPTANPTPEESALGGGARKKSVVTDIPSSTQSAVKISGSSRQEVGQIAANTRHPSSASTVPPTVATSPAITRTPAKSKKGARRSLESAVLAAGTNSRNIIVGTLGSVQRNARRENLYSTYEGFFCPSFHKHNDPSCPLDKNDSSDIILTLSGQL
jgi:hypothetical protein